MNKNGKFDWLANVIYPLAVVLMEAFWLYPWLVWVGGWPVFTVSRPLLSLVSVIIVLAVALLVTRVVLRQKWPTWLMQVVIIGGGLVALLMVLGVEYGSGYTFLSGRWFVYVVRTLGVTFVRPHVIVLALPALLYLWWRGINLGRKTAYFRDIYRTFLLGMAGLITLIVLWQASSASGKLEAPGPGIAWNVIAFFFFGLMAIAIRHLYLMRSSMPREEAALTSVRRWLPVMMGVIGGMVVVVFGVASIFSEDFFQSVGHVAGAVFGCLGKIFNYILIPFNYLLVGILWVFRFFIDLLRSDQPLQPGNSGNMSFSDVFPETTAKELPPEAIMAVKWVLIALVIAVVIFILTKAISRLRARSDREDIEEIHESLWSWRGLRDDLRLLFGMLGQRFKRRPAPASPGYRFDDVSGRLDIREIYRRLLREAARTGMARRRPETAREYASRLEQWVPEGSEPLARITDLYTIVRYGEVYAPEGQVDSTNSLWKKLRDLLRGQMPS